MDHNNLSKSSMLSQSHSNYSNSSNSRTTSPNQSSPVNHLHNYHQHHNSNSGGSIGGGGGMSDTMSDNVSLGGSAESFTPEKYQRLATEYAKLRAKFVVLKNAVVDERSKTSELKSELNSRDQVARRLQQEMESLQFRNQQLTKRVSVLQTDCEHASSHKRSNLVSLFSGNSQSGGHGSNSSSTSSSHSSHHHRRDRSSSQSSGGGASGLGHHHSEIDPVLFEEINYELKNKIEENERLLELNNELENCRLQHVERLEHQIKKLISDSEEREKVLGDEIRSVTTSLANAKQEKVIFEKKLKQTLTELRDVRSNINDLKFENANLKGRLTHYEQMIVAKQQLQQNQPLTPTRISNRTQSSHTPSLTDHSSSLSLSPLSNAHHHSPLSNLNTVHFQQHDHSATNSNNIDINSSYSSRSYQDIGLRQAVLEEFISKLIELTSALSMLHSNVSKKFSILIRLFCTEEISLDSNSNRTKYHFYFLDLTGSAPSSSTTTTITNTTSSSSSSLETTTTINGKGDLPIQSSTNSTTAPPNEQLSTHTTSTASPLSKHRSMPVLSMLKDFNEYLQSRYQGQLKSIEEALSNYCDQKLKQYKLIEKLKKSNSDSSGDSSSNSEIEAIEQRLQEILQQLGQLFASFLEYLNQIDPHLRSCIAAWSRSLRVYDPKSPLSRELLDQVLQSKLADPMNRENLCEKNLMLANSIAAGIEAIAQVYNRVHLFLACSVNREEYLEVFNSLMKRISLLHKIIEDTIGIFSSKVVFEHDMSITIETELKEADDSILSSFVLVGKCVQEVRKFFEVHYFFFVGQSHHTTSAEQQQLLLAESNSSSQHPVFDDLDSDSDSHSSGGFSGQKRQTISRFGPQRLNQTKCSVIDEDDEQSARIIEDLETKLQQSQAKLSAIEREKEHLSIESQLSEVKLEREQKKSLELESQIQSLNSQLKQLSLSGPTTTAAAAASTGAILNRINSNNSASIGAGSVSLGGHSLDNNVNNNNNNFADLGSISSLSNASQSQQSPIENRFVNYPCETPASSTSNTDEVFQFNSATGMPPPPLAPIVATNIFTDHSIESSDNPSVDYLQEKNRKLIDLLQVTDGRAAAYHQECFALRQRLSKLMEEKELVDLRIVVLENELAEAREECQTSVLNYETQLSTMSDHLANLNDQIGHQRDEIELLHYQQQQIELAQPTIKSPSSTKSASSLFAGTASSGNDKPSSNSNNATSTTSQSSLTKTLRQSFRKNKN